MPEPYTVPAADGDRRRERQGASRGRTHGLPTGLAPPWPSLVMAWSGLPDPSGDGDWRHAIAILGA
jgi:hypothetical protein